MKALDLTLFMNEQGNDAWVIDTRLPFDYMQGFVPGALFLGREEKLVQWAKAMVPPNARVVLITNPGEEQKSAQLLQEAGLRHIVGYLQGGIETWIRAGQPIDMIIDIEADELLMDLPHDKKLEVVDVRGADEYAKAHIKGATHKPLHSLADLAELSDLNEEHNLYLHCGGGSKAIIAASLLKKQGYEKLRVITGGFRQISSVPGMPIVESGASLP